MFCQLPLSLRLPLAPCVLFYFDLPEHIFRGYLSFHISKLTTALDHAECSACCHSGTLLALAAHSAHPLCFILPTFPFAAPSFQFPVLPSLGQTHFDLAV